MIDPPWRWKNYSAMHNWRSPESKYQTMELDEVAALPVRELLEPGGVAWVWFTWPMIAEAPNIVEHAWGLRVATGGVWGKRTKGGDLRMGTGLVLRGACEPFLIAQRGTGPGIRGRKVRNLIETFHAQEVDGLAREHSRKPDEVYAVIEALTPGWKRADVFSRQDRHGWDSWGEQAGLFNGRGHPE